jgi:ATP-binding cassette subfamily F protein uup
VSNVVLGLDGQGSAENFADHAQWEDWQAERKGEKTAQSSSVGAALSEAPSSSSSKKKLSYLEAREHAGLEQRIADAEQMLKSKRAELENPAIASDAARLVAAHGEMESAEKTLETLYARWAELEEKAGRATTAHLQ